MALFRCEACGAGLEVQEGSRIAYCPYCGMKQTLPEEAAKSLDAQEKTAATLKRGFMLLEEGQFTKAKKSFDRVLDAEPENGRAYFGKLMASVKARHDYELADRIKEGFEDLNAWKNIDEVNAMLARALEFAQDEMREVFSADFQHALFHMEGGRYQEALGEFWRLSRYHPDAMQKAEECAQMLGTTVEAALKQEFDEWNAASTSMHNAWSRALDLGTQNFSGKYSDSAGLAFVRKEAAEILEAFYSGFEVLGRKGIKPSYRQMIAASYRDFAFSAEQLVLYLDSSYIDYVKASEREKHEFLDDLYRMLNEACTYLEQHDKYNPSGSKDAHYRENLRSDMEKYRPVKAALPQSDSVSQNTAGEYEIRNTKSMPKWLMWLLIVPSAFFLLPVMIGLLIIIIKMVL